MRKRIALITGASSGLGKAYVKAQEAYFKLDELWVVGRNAARLEGLKEQTRPPLRIFEMDLTLPEDFGPLRQALTEECPQIVLLINCAGFGVQGRFDRLSEAQLLQSHQLNTTALLRMTKLAAPYLVPKALVLQVASTAAFLPQAGFAQYAAGKRFVLDFSRALAAEWKMREIKVCAVCPNPMATGFALSKKKDLVARLKRKVQEYPEQVAMRSLALALKGRPVALSSLWSRLFYYLACFLPKGLILALERRSLGS